MTQIKQAKASAWAERTAILVSPQGDKLANILRQLIRGYGWEIIEFTTSIEHGFQRVNSGTAQLMFIDESESLPAGLAMKLQLQNTMAALTPTFYLTNSINQANDINAMSRILASELIIKPVVSKSFQPKFSQLLSRWSTPGFVELRQASLALHQQRHQHAILLLGHLSKQLDTAGIAAPALALILVANKDYKTAERTLLGALVQDPKNVGLILATVGYYLRTGVPELAQRLLNEVRAAYSNPRLLLSDIAQAHLQLNQIGEMIPILADMIRREYLPELSKAFLARVYYTEGMIIDFQESFVGRKNEANRLTQAWTRNIGTKTEAAS